MRKGFTLAEVLIAVVILGIIIPVIFGVFDFQIFAYERTDSKINENRHINYLYEVMQKQVKYAVAAKLISTPPDEANLQKGYSYLYQDADGKIRYIVWEQVGKTPETGDPVGTHKDLSLNIEREYFARDKNKRIEVSEMENMLFKVGKDAEGTSDLGLLEYEVKGQMEKDTVQGQLRLENTKLKDDETDIAQNYIGIMYREFIEEDWK